MTPLIRVHTDLERLDVDGALQETAEAAGVDRSQFLKRTGIAAGGFIAGGTMFSGLMSPAQAAISTRKRSKANDVKILNYALTLEFLEAEFYRQAVANKAYSSDQYRLFAETTLAHEQAHVRTIKSVLRSAAIKKPRFDFGDTVTDPSKFGATAQVLEDTGVAAYAGQGPNILQKPVVVAALSIHSVEARHAAWIRFINSDPTKATGTKDLPAPVSFDVAKSERAILKAVEGTGFIQ